TGNRLTQLAIPWFVLQTTGSVAKTGLVGFFSLLPFVLSSALGGVIVDRLGYRRASIVSDLASGSSVLLVPILYHTVGLPLAALLGLVFAARSSTRPGRPHERRSYPTSSSGPGRRSSAGRASSTASPAARTCSARRSRGC
ncbi:MAG: MFS transporter, partial [Gaiellaceae bacterium]